MKLYVFAATAALLPMTALASEGLMVKDAYARSASPSAQSGAAFMMIENHKDQACTLIGATSDVANMVEVHTHKEDANGVMQMMKVEDGLEIAAGSTHALARGGDHIMFMGLKRPLLDGEKVKVTLDFGDCGTLDTEIPVDNARKPDQPMMGMGGGHMHGKMQGMATPPAPSN